MPARKPRHLNSVNSRSILPVAQAKSLDVGPDLFLWSARAAAKLHLHQLCGIRHPPRPSVALRQVIGASPRVMARRPRLVSLLPRPFHSLSHRANRGIPRRLRGFFPLWNKMCVSPLPHPRRSPLPSAPPQWPLPALQLPLQDPAPWHPALPPLGLGRAHLSRVATVSSEGTSPLPHAQCRHTVLNFFFLF